MPNKANSNSSTNDANYVSQLTDSERKASDIIETARKRKAVKMKKAKDEAQIEIEEFKKESENKLKHAIGNYATNQDRAAIGYDKNLKDRVYVMNADFEKHRKKTLEFVLKQFSEVKLEIHQNFRD